ncbi:branched-chain amino acid transporter permease [Gordonia neofelifaecis]|uniref:Branched chain amino acid ABC transporter n=1 Tax=Gordonia neofelifaecis NRRL B-59395 TaxID=644548 RepID=F1YJ57_9ACTN|nr:AzlD domain-containing protein [Gordonia neofelifaecis]EGD55272.1 branched chain amino acid ABC transporter [Gordonia neofelifaecis NRRL B-59395]
MPSTGYLLSAIATAAAITFALRAIPFALPKRIARAPMTVYLRDALPVGAVLILAVYCVVDIDFSDSRAATAQLIGAAVTVGVHLWRRNVLLSLLVGTAVVVTLSSVTW